MSLGDPVLHRLTLTWTYLGLCVVPRPMLCVSCKQYHCIALMACQHGQGCPDCRSRLQTIVCGLVFHVHSWISFVHRSIEHRFYRPCDRTGYAGFSVQARFLNLVSAVLSLNSLCQFILCVNNLLPQEVIIFGVLLPLLLLGSCDPKLFYDALQRHSPIVPNIWLLIVI